MTVSLLLGSFLIVGSFLGLSLGPTDQSIGRIFAVLADHVDADPTLSSIVWQIRFPRVILAALAGAALSLEGLVFQALLRNPLTEPFILGISGGDSNNIRPLGGWAGRNAPVQYVVAGIFPANLSVGWARIHRAHRNGGQHFAFAHPTEIVRVTEH